MINIPERRKEGMKHAWNYLDRDFGIWHSLGPFHDGRIAGIGGTLPLVGLEWSC